jgi:hypothetical protein
MRDGHIHSQAHQRERQDGARGSGSRIEEATAVVHSDQSTHTQECTTVTQSSGSHKTSDVVILATIPIRTGKGGAVPSTITTVKASELLPQSSTPSNQKRTPAAPIQRWKPRPAWFLVVGLAIVVLLVVMVVFSVRAAAPASAKAKPPYPSIQQPVAESAGNQITLEPSQAPPDEDDDGWEKLDDAWKDDQMENASGGGNN